MSDFCDDFDWNCNSNDCPTLDVNYFLNFENEIEKTKQDPPVETQQQQPVITQQQQPIATPQQTPYTQSLQQTYLQPQQEQPQFQQQQLKRKCVDYDIHREFYEKKTGLMDGINKTLISVNATNNARVKRLETEGEQFKRKLDELSQKNTKLFKDLLDKAVQSLYREFGGYQRDIFNSVKEINGKQIEFENLTTLFSLQLEESACRNEETSEQVTNFLSQRVSLLETELFTLREISGSREKELGGKIEFYSKANMSLNGKIQELEPLVTRVEEAETRAKQAEEMVKQAEEMVKQAEEMTKQAELKKLNDEEEKKRLRDENEKLLCEKTEFEMLKEDSESVVNKITNEVTILLDEKTKLSNEVTELNNKVRKLDETVKQLESNSLQKDQFLRQIILNLPKISKQQ